jgi:UDP-2,3-diacylglucosamine hydrolase
VVAHRESPAALPLPEATPTFTAPAAWRAIDFISDLHLAAYTPRTFDAWAAHLQNTSADAVFILGDLFEAWVGDDLAETDFEAHVVAVMKAAAQRRTIAFMAGNRDFLVGDAMLESLGVMRLCDPTLLLAFDRKVLVSHGDALCLGDTAYQRYRSVVRRAGVQRAFLALPRSWRRRIGQRARSYRDSPRLAGQRRLVDVDATAAQSWLRDSGAPVLVHGHTHAPASHELAAGAMRHVLSDWDLEGAASRAEVLRWTADGLARIAPEAAAPAGSA